MNLHEDRDTFFDLIEATAQRIGLPEVYIEKDYWITRALQYLSRSPYIDSVVFKGGTSLSKAHKLIARFSEDIDLAVITSSKSDNARKKLIKNIENTVTTDLTYIPGDERESKGSKFRRTVYQYPRIINPDNFGQASPELLVELNSFTKPEPVVDHQLQSLIAEVLISENKNDLVAQYNLESFSINVLSVNRTLIEKMLCVIKDSYSSEPLQKLTIHIRHLYDIDSILQQEAYRQFIASSDFDSLIKKCVDDEKAGNFEEAGCLDLPLVEAPLFTNFGTWSKSLEQVYKGDFADLVYQELPPIGRIEASLTLLKNHLR